MNKLRQTYWERKILAWENARYSSLAILNPASWSIRARRRNATKIIADALPQPRVIELGCGSGTLLDFLKYKTYQGFDLSTVAIERARKKELPNATFQVMDVSAACPNMDGADITVMLGLTDWLEPEELNQLFSRITTEYILFSYTQKEMRAGLGLFLYRIYRSFYDKNRLAPRQYEAEFFQAKLEALGYFQLKDASSSIFPGILLLWKKRKA